MLPVAPVVAEVGAVIATLPAAVEPSSQVNNVKLAGDGLTANPWTHTRYVAAVGLRRFTSSSAVPPPLEPTSVPIGEQGHRKTYRSRSSGPLTNALKSENRACVVPAGTTTSNETVPGPPGTKLSVGSSATEPGEVTAGTKPRTSAANAPV